MSKISIRVLGAMTGTSCDGLDAACVEFTLKGWKSLWQASTSYPPLLRKRVLAFQKPGSLHTSLSWLELHRDLGSWYARTFRQLIKKNSPGKLPDLIANHGQTIAHFPKNKSQGTTLQLGDNTRVSVATGLSVVTQFREGDMAAGGEGAPLAPLFHRMLLDRLGDGKPGVSIHNLGGISNLTYLGPSRKILAFDTGPANVWIDAATEKVTQGRLSFDHNGALARRGIADLKAVKALLQHPYFSRPLPKSTGRDEFHNPFFFAHARQKDESLVTTATEVTVESIARAYETWILNKGLPLRKIYFSGGGAKNLTLLSRLRKRLPKIEISTLNELGFDSQYVEAQAFSYFGFRSLLGKPLGGSWTGAKDFGPPGHLIPGKNWPSLLRKTESFQKLIQKGF